MSSSVANAPGGCCCPPGAVSINRHAATEYGPPYVATGATWYANHPWITAGDGNNIGAAANLEIEDDEHIWLYAAQYNPEVHLYKWNLAEPSEAAQANKTFLSNLGTLDVFDYSMTSQKVLAREPKAFGGGFDYTVRNLAGTTMLTLDSSATNPCLDSAGNAYHINFNQIYKNNTLWANATVDLHDIAPYSETDGVADKFVALRDEFFGPVQANTRDIGIVEEGSAFDEITYSDWRYTEGLLGSVFSGGIHSVKYSPEFDYVYLGAEPPLVGGGYTSMVYRMDFTSKFMDASATIPQSSTQANDLPIMIRPVPIPTYAV